MTATTAQLERPASQVMPKPGRARAVGCDDLLCPVVVLYARSDSIYKTLPGCDVWDAERDARNYRGKEPVVAHPPCGPWGRLRAFCKHPEQKDLARHAVRIVRENGGVLEHPAGSTLWEDQSLPEPGAKDKWGGWTMTAPQWWWGHRAEKASRFYIVGCDAKDLPEIPMRLGEPTHVIQSRKRRDYRPHVTKPEREHTPVELAKWLLEVARLCGHNDKLTDGGCVKKP